MNIQETIDYNADIQSLSNIAEELQELKEAIEDQKGYDTLKIDRSTEDHTDRIKLDFGEYNIFFITKTARGTLEFTHKTEGVINTFGHDSLESEKKGTFKEFENILELYSISLSMEDKEKILSSIAML